MTNLLKQAIGCDDGDRAAKIIQNAVARRPRAARPHHWRLAAD
jgi:hypothetical protein